MILGGLKGDPRTKAHRSGAGRAERREPVEPIPHAGTAGTSRARTLLSLLGLVALVLWCVWWTNSVRADRLTSGRSTWVPVLPFLAGDFVHNIDAPARLWVAGGNPYQNTPMTVWYPYPPIVVRLFAWVSLLTPWTALVVWLGALTAMAVAGARACWKTRRELGLAEVPLPIVVAAVLFSTPILFALERGNYDLLVLLAVLGALRLMRDRSAAAEVGAGLVLAVAGWSKLYPGLLVLGLLALRRRRVLAGFVLAGAVIGLADVDGLRRFFENNRGMVAFYSSLQGGQAHPVQHSLSGCWRHLWAATPLYPLAEIPGRVATLGLLGPLLLWISVRVARCPDRGRLAYPYLLWILAVATFVPPLANDYNLFFLPMAALAVWDRRDPVYVHVLMAFLLLWWQPLALPIDGRVLMAFKLSGLLAVGLCLCGRAGEACRRVAPESP